MGILDEIKHDAAGAGAMLGVLIGAVLLYFLWSMGTIVMFAVLALIGLGVLAWTFRDRIGGG